MADDSGSRGKHVLTTLLVLVVVGLAAVLAGLKYVRGKGKGLTPSPPPKSGQVQVPPEPEREDPRAVQERVRRLCQEARAALRDEDHLAAYECWREAHELAPSDDEITAEYENARDIRDFLILFEQGEAALGEDDLEQALVYFAKALELRPNMKELEERATFCRFAIPLREAQAAEKKEDWKTVEAKAKEALKHNPDGALAKELLERAQQKIAGISKPPDQTPNPPPDAEQEMTVRKLEERINALQKENLIESYIEAAKLCDEMEKLLKTTEKQEAVRKHKKLIAEKRADYERLYAQRLAEARTTMEGDLERGRPSEPGRAIALAEQLKGKYRKDTTEVDALIMECRRRSVMSDMVLVPEGMFEVGGSEGESPRRQVIVGNFFLDRREVTNQQFKAFVDATGARPPRGWTEGRFPPGLEHYPVMGISYQDAEAFCKWAGKRLPTEDEWEVAASGGTTRRFPWGDEFVAGCANTKEKGSTGPTMVGAHPEGKSPYGVLDMIGNVAEWTSSTTPDAKNPSATVHIAKGGNYMFGADHCTVASRFTSVGNIQLYGYGFRCVIDASPEAIERYNKEHSSAGDGETSSK